MQEKRNLNSRKITKTLLILSFAFVGIVNCAKAQIIDQGTCGANLTWVLTSDSVLTISGNGDIQSYGSYVITQWNGHQTSIATVIIGDSVTGIGSGAFVDCINLTSVTIPNNITKIWDWAFQGCSSLTSIIIPSSVITIGYGAFGRCSSLTSINVDNNNPNYSSNDGIFYNKLQDTLIQCPGGKTGSVAIPNTVNTILYSAFNYCTSLTSVTIPNSVTTIEDWAFGNCTNLISMTIPNSVTTIKYATFANCNSLISVSIPNNVTSIEGSAFVGCTSLSSIIIPNSIVTIGVNAFAACSSLTTITIPSSVTSIGGGAFSNSGLTSATIPSSITNIEDWTFASCYNLTSITIPSGITNIGVNAFYACNLNTIICKAIIPPDITTSTFLYVPTTANIFVPCASLEAYQTADFWNYFTNYQAIESPNPSNVQVSQQNNSLLITWSNSSATNHKIYRNNQLLTTVNTTNYTDNNLTNGTEYCYKIKAINGNCESGFSQEECKTFTAINSGTTISGKVKRQNQTTLSSGLVSLYRLQTLSQYTLIDAVPIESDGSYLFTNVSLGSYIIKAVPTNSENALPTYYGNTEIWNQAVIVTVGNNSLQNMDITIISLSTLGGSSVISGYVGENNSGKKSILKSATDNPIADVDVYLQNQQSSEWTTIAQSVTNEEGYFEFKNVPIGRYRVILDIPGLPMNNPPIIEITEDGEIVDNLEFEVTDEGINSLAVNDILKEKGILLYPNPTNGKLFVDYEYFTTITIKFYDILGKEILTQTVNGKTEINISHLPQGIYNVNIISEGKVIGNSKIVKQ